MGARDRIEFHVANGAGIARLFSPGDFSTVIFGASLEHMTFDERMRALKAAKELLGDGGSLVVIDTPNRLWFFDDHTSMSHFFHWLPDDVAFAYAPRSPRADFASDVEAPPPVGALLDDLQSGRPRGPPIATEADLLPTSSRNGREIGGSGGHPRTPPDPRTQGRTLVRTGISWRPRQDSNLRRTV